MTPSLGKRLKERDEMKAWPSAQKLPAPIRQRETGNRFRLLALCPNAYSVSHLTDLHGIEEGTSREPDACSERRWWG